MVRISFVLISALFAGSLALHQGPSPLVRIAENEGLKKLLHESAVRMAYAAKSTPFDGKIKGVFRTFGTNNNYSGNFRGKHIGNQFRATYDIVMTGMYRMFGWNGKLSAGLRGSFRMTQFGKYLRAITQGKLTFRFLGTVDGRPASSTARGIFRLDSDNKGMFKVTESGSFVAIIGRIKAIGTYKSKVSRSGFSTRMVGTIEGRKRKFNILFKGTIEDMYELFPIDNSGTVMGSYGGKPFGVKYGPKVPGMIQQ